MPEWNALNVRVLRRHFACWKLVAMLLDGPIMIGVRLKDGEPRVDRRPLRLIDVDLQ